MPPLRTPPMNKPIKTERSHEENQERAYIAASRRSDRSLEARIESARRASEIHKKRTGRGLRVTEQDVINEEMYEEEDDDLPAQYQRLTAHLHTNSMMFNRRLHSYLATQHAMRTGDGMPSPDFTNPVIPNPYLYPMMPTFINQPMMGTHMFQQSQQPQPQTMPQQSQHPQSPNMSQSQQPRPHISRHGYTQSPYLLPNRPNIHQRSASISNPQDLANFQSAYFMGNATGTTVAQEQHELPEHRRMSFPPQAFEHSSIAQPNTQMRPSVSRPSTSDSPSGIKSESPNNRVSSQAPTTPKLAGTPPTYQESSLPQSSNPFVPNISTNFDTLENESTSPLTASLPAESQQFLGSALDAYDPRTSMLMAGSEIVPQPFLSYSYNPNLSSKPRQTQAPNTGMNQTLAPSSVIQVDTTGHGFLSNNPPSAVSEPIMPSYAFTFANDDPVISNFNEVNPTSASTSNLDNSTSLNDENFEDFINL